MALEKLLIERKAPILERWIKLILDTYPADSYKYLSNFKDRFNNPIGYTISQETGTILDEILDSMNPEKLRIAVDNIIRIRSVQNYTAAEAAAVIFLLKKAARDELEMELAQGYISTDLLAFESKIDEVALLAFDVFMQCREKISEIRINEIKRMSTRLFDRINSSDENL